MQVLGNTYYALYRINYEKETYEMIKGSAYVKERIPISGAYTELLRVAGEVIEPEAFKDFMQSFSVRIFVSLFTSGCVISAAIFCAALAKNTVG